MKKRAVRGWWPYCIVPLAVFGFSILMHSCGGDDNCKDLEVKESQEACQIYGDQFGCSSINFEASTGLCVVDNCTLCSCTDVNMTTQANCTFYGLYFGCLSTFDSEAMTCQLGGKCNAGAFPGKVCSIDANCRDATICRLTCPDGVDCMQNPNACPADQCARRCAAGIKQGMTCTRAADCDEDPPPPPTPVATPHCLPSDPPNPRAECQVCGFKSDVF